MTRQNPLRAALDEGRPTIGTHAFLTEPTIIEIIGATGLFDYVEFVGEYAAFHLPDLENISRAARLHGLGTMIKVDFEQRRYVAQRAVGSGFDGVLFADVRTLDDVRYSVRSVRPDAPEHGGSYGARPHAIAVGYGEAGSPAYIERIADTVAAIMVEKPEIVDDLEAILAQGEVDMVQWGPSDFAMSSGLDPVEDATRIAATERHVIDVCAQAGVPARVELKRAEDLRRYADLGVRHYCVGWDVSIFCSALEDLGESTKAILAEYA